MQAILVSHNPDERDILSFVLKHAGLSVASSSSLERVAARWLERPSDIILTAWGNGRNLLAEITELRAVTQIPLLLLIDPTTDDIICQLIQTGADLILQRPVSPRIIAEYTHAFLRRTRTVPTFVLPRLNVTSIKLDPDSRTVTLEDGETRRLTQLEFRLLYVLMVNRGQVIPVDVIVERVWGYTGQGSRELVRGLVSRLRRKIEPNGREPRFIQNVPGVGYRFTLEET